ncbi:hypothetical protein V1291_003727 [Nitrobacteraceae bacterium AZCC 1564]
MNKLFLAVAPVIVAGPIAIGSIPASAGPFCATYSDGGSYRSCGYPTYASCLRTISGAGGMCVVNPYFDSYGYESSYAYAPGPAYGTTDYPPAPRYYRRPGVDMYIGDDIE